MALNTETGIDAAVDRFVVKTISTDQTINMNAVWPRAGGEAAGINPDHAYYKKVAPEPPPIDHRFTLIAESGFTLLSPAPGPGLPVGTYGTVFTIVKRELPELLAQIETEYQRQVRLQFPETENPSTIVNVGGILIKQQSGAVLTEAETASLAAFVAVRDALVQLAVRRQELIDAATAEEDYDLTVWPVL
jgi:hypothetical protein